MQNTNFEPTLINKIYKFYFQSYGMFHNFPKQSRYTLGQKIETITLDLLEMVSLANQEIRTLREPHLRKASAKCESVKLLIRMGYDLKLFNDHQYIALENQVQEIGKMIGGWIKYLRTF